MGHRPPRDPDEQERKAREKLTAHRGKATWGERLVPLGDFQQAAAEAGQRLSPEERAAAKREYLAPAPASSPKTSAIEGPWGRVAVFGGVYNNRFALEALLDDARRRGAEAVYCLGDLGGFGPQPEKVRPLLEQGEVRAIQGNYEESLAAGREDCNCGYTDPRDNHFAALSYGYTERGCSPGFKDWMGRLPRQRRIRVGDRELLLVHGSPRRINEFLFASTSPVPFLEVLVRQAHCDGVLCTHTGLHWHRRLPSGADLANVGVIGRPANNGQTCVWYAFLEASGGSGSGRGPLSVELVPLRYDHPALAREMRREELPEEFVETIETGWWTTCLEILPAKERARSRF